MTGFVEIQRGQRCLYDHLVPVAGIQQTALIAQGDLECRVLENLVQLHSNPSHTGKMMLCFHGRADAASQPILVLPPNHPLHILVRHECYFPKPKK